ncbi:TetR/AcrR family transcriptional regulator [Anaerovorax sp. IOR16]|uniref:TetR/AcrR family transcriptional regulator n=1 Tax=Anaerovorax sp. IOR16 TaxID=2773458 RepID=UPI0019D06D10|nr:TetR/AcrR family transcriptional regulator [Anaerovorax sp. IOR16]
MKAKTSRTLQAENTKNRILDEALKLMEQKNYDDISIKEICKNSGVSVGAFYHHFISKSGIVVAAYERTDDFFQTNIIKKIDYSNIKKAIVLYLCEQGAYAEYAGIDIIRNIYKAQMDNGSMFFLSKDRALPKGLHDLIVKGQETGQLSKSKDADQITDELLIISRGVIYNWALSSGNYQISDKMTAIVCGFLESL